MKMVFTSDSKSYICLIFNIYFLKENSNNVNYYQDNVGNEIIINVSRQ
jgi:hypothetical protein